jgi:hypothetical protein
MRIRRRRDHPRPQILPAGVGARIEITGVQITSAWCRKTPVRKVTGAFNVSVFPCARLEPPVPLIAHWLLETELLLPGVTGAAGHCRIISKPTGCRIAS